MRIVKLSFSLLLALFVLLGASCGEVQPPQPSQPTGIIAQPLSAEAPQPLSSDLPLSASATQTDNNPEPPFSAFDSALFTPSSDLTVHFLDVGQADCIIAELPNSQILMIDGGSRSSRQVVLGYINSLGIETIDYLVITHPHEDHIGGLPEVIDAFDIGMIYMPRASNNTQIFERLLIAIQDNGYSINTARAGVNIFSSPELKIDIVAPVGDSYRDLNDYSAVVRLVYGSIAFLFTGDAEAVSEGEITADIRADVLKVSHHGSHTSTSQSFLNKVEPSYAVISVGSGNSYGHPSDAVMSRLSAAGVSVYRTDESGTIVIVTDGESININASIA